MVRYQAKANKTAVVMSTLHRGSACQIDGKKKPESVLYYNANRCGVDMLNSICRQMSTKARCRRWTLAVFRNMLEQAGVNARIISKKVTGSNIQRRTFLHK
jgi:Transposase IS4